MTASRTKKPLESMQLGDIADTMQKLADDRRKLSAKDKELRDEYALLEQAALTRMETDGLQRVAGKHASLSKNVQIVPQVIDWDAFYRFIARTKGYHLLERRVSVAAWREQTQLRKGKPVPGTSEFEKVSLHRAALS